MNPIRGSHDRRILCGCILVSAIVTANASSWNEQQYGQAAGDYRPPPPPPPTTTSTSDSQLGNEVETPKEYQAWDDQQEIYEGKGILGPSIGEESMISDEYQRWGNERERVPRNDLIGDIPRNEAVAGGEYQHWGDEQEDQQANEQTDNRPADGNVTPEEYQRWSEDRESQDRDERSPPSAYKAQPSQSSYNPIHYEFESKEESAGSENGRFRQKIDQTPSRASARRDPVTRYQSQSSFNRLKLLLASGTIGAALGGFVGQAIMNVGPFFAYTTALVFIATSFFRGAYGELVRALGMMLILAIQRSVRVRKQYPTWVHVKASIGAGPRRAFPPGDNLWQYQPRDRRDPDFNMLYTVIAMVLVGSTCGGNIPLIPNWIGGLAGAAVFGLGTLAPNSRGDLIRSMGMRVVRWSSQVIEINSELRLVRQSGVVAGKILEKILILDRKHKIKDRIASLVSSAYDRATNTASGGQADREGSRDPRDARDRRRRSDGPDDRDERDYDRRRRPEDRDEDDRRRRFEDRRDRDEDRRRRPGDRRDRDDAQRRRYDDVDDRRRRDDYEFRRDRDDDNQDRFREVDSRARPRREESEGNDRKDEGRGRRGLFGRRK